VRKLAAVIWLALLTSACVATPPIPTAAPIIHGYGYDIYGSYRAYSYTYGYAHLPPHVRPVHPAHHRFHHRPTEAHHAMSH
jgi:hypothetical protein